MQYLAILGGLVLLVLGGNYLVMGGVQFARHFKISAVVVGLTVVAFGTSAPELFVSASSAFKGLPDFAIGNVVGSNIANIALVLALTAMVFPIAVNGKEIIFDFYIMIAASVIFYLLILDDDISRIEGFLLFSGIVAYVIYSIRRSKKNTDADKVNKPTMNIWLAVALIVISSAGLAVGSNILVWGAEKLALQFGVSEKVISITLIAFGTSVPELATSVIAAIKKEADISLGNIVGSNIFNILTVLGVTGIIHPIEIENFELTYRIDFIAMLAVAILLLVFIFPLVKSTITRWKGAILFALYCYYVYQLF